MGNFATIFLWSRKCPGEKDRRGPRIVPWGDARAEGIGVRGLYTTISPIIGSHPWPYRYTRLFLASMLVSSLPGLHLAEARLEHCLRLYPATPSPAMASKGDRMKLPPTSFLGLTSMTPGMLEDLVQHGVIAKAAA